jgi:CelD/BcsL family acetyltransferase involved in cellulose biosynthesis
MGAATALSTEWRPLAALGAIASAWRELCGRAAEPNVFYEPAFALAAAPPLGRDAGAVLVWSQGRLRGLFPLRVERCRYGLPLPLLSGWTHPYGPLGTPLIDRDGASEVVAAFLDHLGGDATLPRILRLPYLADDGAVAHAFDAEIARRGLAQAAFGRHRRALLKTTADGKTYLDAALGKKRRGELARQRRRLADISPLACEFETAPAPVAAILADFLAIEAAGWKGRAGTAAGRHPDITAFMTQAVGGLAAEGKVVAGRLRQAAYLRQDSGVRQDARTIAAILVIRSGAGAWTWKIAHDEAFARASPGVQILLEATERLLGEPGIAWSDSCATPDHPMIDHVWRERVTLSDRLVAVSADAGAAFALACRLETLRGGAIAVAKRAREALRQLRA